MGWSHLLSFLPSPPWIGCCLLVFVDAELWLIPELCLTNAELCLVNRGCCLVNAYGESCVCWMLNAKCGVMFGGCCFQECWLMMFNVDRDWWVMFELWWLFVSYVCGIVIECWMIACFFVDGELWWWMLSSVSRMLFVNAELCWMYAAAELWVMFGECWMLNAKCTVVFGECCCWECWVMMFNVDHDWWVMFELWW